MRVSMAGTEPVGAIKLGWRSQHRQNRAGKTLGGFQEGYDLICFTFIDHSGCCGKWITGHVSMNAVLVVTAVVAGSMGAAGEMLRNGPIQDVIL